VGPTPLKERELPCTGCGVQTPCYASGHSFVTHLLDGRFDIRTIRELLGHKDVTPIMIYIHVLNKGGHRCAARSPGYEPCYRVCIKESLLRLRQR
jgi:integrase